MFKFLKTKNDKSLKIIRESDNLVKMLNEDPRVINEKCKCQNENVIKCIENESEMKPYKCKNEKRGICGLAKQGLVQDFD